MDESIAGIGLPRHPHPKTLAVDGQALVDRLRSKGPAALEMARLLSARGWGTSTLGDDGARSTDSTSTTERAGTQDFRDPWWDADMRLATALALYAKASRDLNALMAALLAHAEDVDPVPVGTGECQACGRFCRPDKTKPGNRLRSGLCPSDYEAWRRAGKPVRTDWVRMARKSNTDDTGTLHTPEPDHDIDLSRE